jgi:hypothetical protein
MPRKKCPIGIYPWQRRLSRPNYSPASTRDGRFPTVQGWRNREGSGKERVDMKKRIKNAAKPVVKAAKSVKKIDVPAEKQAKKDAIKAAKYQKPKEKPKPKSKDKK